MITDSPTPAAPAVTPDRSEAAPAGALARLGAARRRFVPDRILPVAVTVALLLAMFGGGAASFEGFGSGQVVANLFIDNAFLIVLAVGMTFVILTGGIDLSVGSVVALSGMILAATLKAGWPPALAFLAVLATGTLLGWLMGLVIHHLEIQPFIVTLAGMFLARGLCFLIDEDSLAIREKSTVDLANASVTLPGDVIVTMPAILAVVVVLVAAAVLAWTRFGRTVYAVGGSEASAGLMGLPVARVKVGVYAISGFCSGLAGLLFALYSLSGYPRAAIGMELDAIAAVVIGGTLLTGGTGYVLGSLAGVLVLGVIQTLISFDGTLNSWWTRIVIGVLLLAFIVVQRFLLRRRA
ncbi:MAG: galactofuranose ABC transporter, permease protein YjfF [Kineosporiaceae bacterium]